MNPMTTPTETDRLEHMIELLELARKARSFVGDHRFSTLSDGTRVQVSS